MRNLLLTILAVISVAPSLAWTKRQDAHGKTIIAYYASWQWYDRNGLAKPSNLDHSKVTRYNFAFFQINSSGDIWGTDEWADAITLYGEFDWNWVEGQGTAYCSWDYESEPPNCAGHHYEGGLIDQAHKAGVEVYPSIGGWTLSDPFPALAADEAARNRFAQNCVDLIEAYDFDGIDIDWEYPGYAAHSGTPEDTVNYTLFLQAIRDALDALGAATGRFYGLTAALPCGPDLINNIQIDQVSDIMTELNLMTYDFHGSWNTETGANAPLFDMDGSPEFSVHGCVENWKAGGGRPEQINIGLPFYGRSFSGSGITGFGQSHNGYADTTTWSDDEGSPQYFNIVDRMSQFTTVRDAQTKTQYMYNTVGFVSYDDERAICDKTEYAMDNNLNGYIIWEISGDILPDLSTPLLDATNDRLNNPSVRCQPDAQGDAPGNNAVGGVVDMIQGGSNVWYPSQALGHCVNDGKQLENYMAPDQQFGSASACCKAFFNHNSDCTATSENPGSDGQWVSLDGTATDNPWYPNPTLGYCVNDGREDQFYTAADAKFSSPEACCKGIYSFDPDCVSHSKNPGSDGGWVAGLHVGNPWYPQATVGHCVSDGKHEQNFIEPHQQFNSAAACCDAIYSFNADCLSLSNSLVDEGAWYPNGNGCSSESPVPSWITQVFDSEDECCEKHFGEHFDTCVNGQQAATHPPTSKPTLNPTPRPVASGTNPNEMNAYVTPPADNAQNFNPRPTRNPTPNPTPRPKSSTDTNNMDAYVQDAVTTPEPTPQPTKRNPVTADTVEYALTEFLFYPYYGGDGKSVECRNDGNKPEWISKNMMKASRYECCESYFFPSWAEQCNADQPFYPNFQDGTCVNDGNHPSWMAGDYLVQNEWLCCHNFYHDDDVLQSCTGIPPCADCDLSQYLSDYFAAGG